MLTADKRRVFSFHGNGKNQFKGFKTQKYIQFISFPRLLRAVSDCSVKEASYGLLNIIFEKYVFDDQNDILNAKNDKNIYSQNRCFHN